MTQHHAGRHFLQIPGPSPVPDRFINQRFVDACHIATSARPSPS